MSSSIHVTRTDTMNDDNKEEYDCIQQIFHDPENENSRRWIWRKNLEITRSDMRNSGFYANYVGSKGTRKHAANNDNSKAKPSHYLKHLVKIGCPHHDLKPIFENDLKFNVNTTICTHKSWKCGNNINNNFGQLIHELSMDEVGLEFKRSAYSVKPLLIKYGSSFITNIFCKRIANTNFNKIFRPGSYGNSPSLKKGSWKDGKVFYVFKNDKLVLNVDNFINIVFELESPKTIINDNKNKHYIIDGWQNVVGGVGFYSPSNNKKSSKHRTKSIETVLVFRKSMDFPKECLEQSKVKIYINNNADNRILNHTEKLIIGSKQLSLNVPPIDQSMPILQQSSINNTSAGSMAYSSGSNSPVLLPSVSNSPSPLIDHEHIHSIPMPEHEQSIMITDGHLTNTFDADSGSVGQTSHSGSDMSIPCGGYGAHHGSSRSVQSYRYNPMQSINEEYHDQYVTNQDYYEIQDKLQKDNYNLNQQNQYLSTKVQSLTSLNKQFMEENDRLMQEKNELEQRIAMLQNSLAQQQQSQHQQSSQFEATEYMQLPQASQSSSQWMDNSTLSDGHMIQMNMNGNIHRNLNDINNKYHIADEYTMDYTMNNNINLNNNSNHHSQSYHHDEMNYNYVDVGQPSAVHNDYGLNISNPFINNNDNNTNIYAHTGHQYQ